MKKYITKISTLLSKLKDKIKSLVKKERQDYEGKFLNHKEFKCALLGVCVIAIFMNIFPAENNIRPLEEETSFATATIEKLELYTVANALEREYVGFVSKELESLGFKLEMVKNPSEMIEGFEGNIYTKETLCKLQNDFDTSIRINGENLDIQKVENFALLENQENFEKSTDLNGDAYFVSQDGKTKFYTRGIQSVLIDNGEIFYAFFAYMNDYEVCKDLNINVLDGITIDSTITDVVNKLGKPNCIDVYEVKGETPYVLCYYENEEKNKKISLIFESNRRAKNGYYLSEVTISMIE